MAKNNKKPGAYIWFDKWNPLARRLNFEQKGKLIDAVMKYCQSGEKTSFDDDPLVDMAFEVLSQSAEMDDENYAEAVAKKKLSGHYSRFISKAKQEERISYDEWLEMNPDLKREAAAYGESKRTIKQQVQHTLTGANTCQPTTTPSTTPNTATTPSTTTEPKTETNSKATNKDNSLGKIEDKKGSGEKGEREQAFSRAQFMKDLEAEFAEDDVEVDTQDADISFGEETGYYLGDVEESGSESESVVDEPKREVVCNPNTTQTEGSPKPAINIGNGIVFAMNHMNVPKQKIYAEPEDGESEEEFQERRRKEMIAKLMGSMPQEQTEYCAQRLSSIRSIGELPVQRTVS